MLGSVMVSKSHIAGTALFFQFGLPQNYCPPWRVVPSSTILRASALLDSVIWRHCAKVLQTLPFFTSEPVTSTLRHLMVWSEPATASVVALVVAPASNAGDAAAGV
jgi:hypothetical protein